MLDIMKLGFVQIAFGGGEGGGGGGSDSGSSRAPTSSPRPKMRPTPPPDFGNDRDDSPAPPPPAPAPAPVRAPAPPPPAPAPAATKAPPPTESTKRVFGQAPVPAAQPNVGRGSDPRLFDPSGTSLRSYVDPEGNLTQLGAQRVGAMAGEPANQQDFQTFEDILAAVAPAAPVAPPAVSVPSVTIPAPSGVASLAPAPPVMESLRPTMRPTTVSLPTTDPETGTRGTADVSFQEYANLPRDEEGFLDLTSPEAQLINLDVQRPADFGTPEGFALEDALYFGEDSMRSRMQEPPTGIEGLFRGTMLGSTLGSMADRQQQIAYNQLVQGPNYRGTPIAPTGNFLYDSAAGLFGDRSLDQDASRYVAVTENGQVIGSLAVDAAGNPIGYRGTRSENAELMDPSVDMGAAASFIRPEAAATGGDTPPPVAAAPAVDPCPEGYTFDPTTESCVMDAAAEQPLPPFPPFPQPGPQMPTEVMPTSGYTAVSTLPAILPLSPQPTFAIPRPRVAPITVPAQTGLASLRT